MPPQTPFLRFSLTVAAAAVAVVGCASSSDESAAPLTGSSATPIEAPAPATSESAAAPSTAAPSTAASSTAAPSSTAGEAAESTPPSTDGRSTYSILDNPEATSTTSLTVEDTAPDTDTDPVGDRITDTDAAEGSPAALTADNGTEPVVVDTETPESVDDAPVVAPEPRPANTDPVVAPNPPLVATSGNGDDTQRAQEFLLSLGFWLAEPNGSYDHTTTQAVMAFQKYAGLETDGQLGPKTAEALNAVTERPVGRSTVGDLVEVDKSKQLVFLIADGATEWVLNTSTGKEIEYRYSDPTTPGGFLEGDSVTYPGMFTVNRERNEGWWDGDLGEIYRPKYFDGGIALHGATSIPAYPASHGCVRLSVEAMDWIWDAEIIPRGTTVWVHGEIPGADEA